MPPIVSAAWLHEHLGDRQIAIADCRFSLADPNLGRQQYATSHIPGAYYFDLNQDLSSPVGKHGGRHPLPDPDQLAAKLSAAGIGTGDRMQTGAGSIAASVSLDASVLDASVDGEPTLVVVYDDARFAFAARFWWLLRYLGHERVVLLDGGFSAWQAAGYAVTAEVPYPQAGRFIPRIQADSIVDIEAVKAKKDLPGVVLVDSREGDRYRGEREPIDPIAGHIPGAVNYPWQAVTDSAGFALPISQQQQRWTTVQNANEILVYCGSGVTACVNLLSLELAGIAHAKLYPGSWSDWCSYL